MLETVYLFDLRAYVGKRPPTASCFLICGIAEKKRSSTTLVFKFYIVIVKRRPSIQLLLLRWMLSAFGFKGICGK